jgi:hypothetical protein
MPRTNHSECIVTLKSERIVTLHSNVNVSLHQLVGGRESPTTSAIVNPISQGLHGHSISILTLIELFSTKQRQVYHALS